MNLCGSRAFGSLLLLAAGLLVLSGAGCRRQDAASGQRTPPNPSAPALYGQPTGQLAQKIPRRPLGPTNVNAWKSAPFAILETELSPATLVRSSTKHLGLFTGTTNEGLGAPTHVAWATRNGPRSFKRGDSLDVTHMDEGWVLVWWAGAEGWTNWDSPWVVYLQHKPDTMRLDKDGLHLDFPAAAGEVVLMPLYGYEKLPTKDLDYRPAHGLPARKPKVQTWKWAEGLTRDPLTRIRFWAAAAREIPIYCEDSFSVDRAKDTITFRSRFTWHSIDDDWKTRHLKLAPLSPPLAHALKLGGFPVALSKSWLDLDLFTPSGPYLVVEGADTFDATFSVLQYVNETEAIEPPVTNAHPTVSRALDRLRQVARDEAPRLSAGDGWLAKALPYCDDSARTNALAALRKHFREESAGPPPANQIEALWAYAHFTGDWDLVKERWPLVKNFFSTPDGPSWGGLGRDGGAEMGGEAARCAAFARMAWKAGDLDSYHYGCSRFARELVLSFLRQRGADFFRQHQPGHSMEFMDDEVFLTSLRSDGSGWQIDGPKYPVQSGERHFTHRWEHFNDFDVARFHREHLREDSRRELDWLQTRWEPKRRAENDPFALSSLVQLRSLLLNESHTGLAAVATPDQFAGPPTWVIASCVAVLRASHSTRYERLIPGGEPSPFVAGPERELAGPNVRLLTFIEHELMDFKNGTTRAAWPRLTWREWKSPTGAPWNFGGISPAREGPPGKGEVVPLNWNSRVVTFAMP